MKWWVSVKNMPELAELTENEKRNIISDSSMRIYGHWQIWVGLIACLIFGRVGGSLGGFFGGSSGSILGAAIAGGIGGCLLGLVMVRLQVWEIRKAVAEHKSRSAI